MLLRSSCRSAWLVSGWVLVFIGASPVAAHNTWMLSSTYSAAGPLAVRLAIITTEHFPTSEYRTAPDRVADWSAWLGGQKTAIRDGHEEKLELVARIRLARPGVHVVAAALHPRFIEFDDAYFEQYLADEHARDALAIRREAGDRAKPGRMCYTKLVKTFVEIGNMAKPDYAIPVGHTLEIVPLSNPCRLEVGDRLCVRVHYEGKPAANVRVSSGHEHMTAHQHRTSESHDYVEDVFTDAAGEAVFTMHCAGQWFLRTHRIRPIKREKAGSECSPQADWESFWASITFRVQGQTGDK